MVGTSPFKTRGGMMSKKRRTRRRSKPIYICPYCRQPKRSHTCLRCKEIRWPDYSEISRYRWWQLPFNCTEPEERIEEYLNSRIGGNRQVRITTGIADVVTPDSVVEVKRFLTGPAVRQAVGQITMYRAELGVPFAVIAGIPTSKTYDILPFVLGIGINVLLLKARERKL